MTEIDTTIRNANPYEASTGEVLSQAIATVAATVEGGQDFLEKSVTDQQPSDGPNPAPYAGLYESFADRFPDSALDVMTVFDKIQANNAGMVVDKSPHPLAPHIATLNMVKFIGVGALGSYSEELATKTKTALKTGLSKLRRT